MRRIPARQAAKVAPRWSAHEVLWRVLGTHAEHVRFHRRLGGVPRLPLPADRVSFG